MLNSQDWPGSLTGNSASKRVSSIPSFALTQCTYGQPFAAIAAHRQFLRQNATTRLGPKASLIIVDSSPYPSQATGYYEIVARKDPRVLYFHIPCRPDRNARFDIEVAAKKYPHAYRWRQGGPFHDLYRETIPTDKELEAHYTNNQIILETLEEYDPKAYNMFHALYVEQKGPWPILERMDLEGFNRATKAAIQTGLIHRRPHLGSKRNFSYAVAKYLGAQAAINLDDDWLMPGYADSQLLGLEEAHFTAKMHYPVLIWTTGMIREEIPPVWGVSDLCFSGQGRAYNFDGSCASRAVTISSVPPMGFSHAVRLGDDLPKVPHILGGEDRAFQKILRRKKCAIHLQERFDPSVVRLVFGRSHSVNIIKEPLLPGDRRLPLGNDQEKILYYTMRLSENHLSRKCLLPLSPEESRAKVLPFRSPATDHHALMPPQNRTCAASFDLA